MAEQGLFVFDSWEGADWAKGYRLVAVPTAPLKVEQLPTLMHEWLSPMRLPRADFQLAKGRPLDISGKGMDWVGNA